VNIENLTGIVDKFLKEENFTLRNALAYAGLGVSQKSGEINKVVTDIAFNGHPYSDERKERIADALGEMMFYWCILAEYTGYNPDEILQQFVNYYLVKNKQVSQEMQASLLELMKHIKTDVTTRDKLQYIQTHQRQKNQIQTEPLQPDVLDKT
jgi:hypothetical protein